MDDVLEKVDRLVRAHERGAFPDATLDLYLLELVDEVNVDQVLARVPNGVASRPVRSAVALRDHDDVFIVESVCESPAAESHPSADDARRLRIRHAIDALRSYATRSRGETRDGS